MPRISSHHRAWLSAEVPLDLAEAFRARARAAERTPTAHLRYLIRSEVSEAPAVTPRLRKDATGQGRHEPE